MLFPKKGERYHERDGKKRGGLVVHTNPSQSLLELDGGGTLWVFNKHLESKWVKKELKNE